jgi:hypothetical protein
VFLIDLIYGIIAFHIALQIPARKLISCSTEVAISFVQAKWIRMVQISFRLL